MCLKHVDVSVNTKSPTHQCVCFKIVKIGEISKIRNIVDIFIHFHFFVGKTYFHNQRVITNNFDSWDIINDHVSGVVFGNSTDKPAITIDHCPVIT